MMICWLFILFPLLWPEGHSFQLYPRCPSNVLIRDPSNKVFRPLLSVKPTPFVKEFDLRFGQSALFLSAEGKDKERKNLLSVIGSYCGKIIHFIKKFLKRLLGLPRKRTHSSETIDKKAAYVSIPSIPVSTTTKASIPSINHNFSNISYPVSESSSMQSTSSSNSPTQSTTFAKIDEKLIAGRKYIENRLKEIQESQLHKKKQSDSLPNIAIKSSEVSSQQSIIAPPMTSVNITSTSETSKTIKRKKKERKVFKSVESIKLNELKDKRVLVNVNFGNEDRLLTSRQVKTIRYLLENQAKVFLLPSYGTPRGNGKYEQKFSTEFLQEKLMKDLTMKNGSKPTLAFIPDVIGTSLPSVLDRMESNHNLFLFENLRFYQQQVENNDEAFANQLAGKNHFHIYVNDDDSTMNQTFVSNYAVAQLIPVRVIGYAVDSKLNEIARAARDETTKFPALGVIDTISIDHH